MPIAIGVDVGGTKVLAAAVDTAVPGVVLTEHRTPTPDDADAIVEAIVGAALAVEGQLASGEPSALPIGVGIPGLVGNDGRLHVAPNLHGLVGVDVRAALTARLGRPVVVDNDANCAGWAEVVAGAGQGCADVVLVTLGTGIGGAVVGTGVLHRGVHGFAGEPGHMVVDPNGPLCPCGRHGCWERYASGSGLAWLARRAVDEGRAPGLLKAAGGEPALVEGELVTAAARSGDPGALEVLEQFSWWLALGIANLVDLLDPELVLIGGGLADESDLFLDRTRAELAAQVLGGPARARARLEVATLGSRAGAIGAALLATRPVDPG